MVADSLKFASSDNMATIVAAGAPTTAAFVNVPAYAPVRGLTKFASKVPLSPFRQAPPLEVKVPLTLWPPAAIAPTSVMLSLPKEKTRLNAPFLTVPVEPIVGTFKSQLLTINVEFLPSDEIVSPFCVKFMPSCTICAGNVPVCSNTAHFASEKFPPPLLPAPEPAQPASIVASARPHTAKRGKYMKPPKVSASGWG